MACIFLFFYRGFLLFGIVGLDDRGMVYYAELKIGLAQRYQLAAERQLYTEAKKPFMWSVIAQADDWACSTGWLLGPSDA